MLGSQIEELLASEMEANGDFAVITDNKIKEFSNEIKMKSK